MNEIVKVPDIAVYHDGTLHSLRGQKVVKSSELHSFDSGSGMVKAGKLYVLDGENVVRMVTGKRSVTIQVHVAEIMTLDWGDGTGEQCYVGVNQLTHEYADNLDSHVILIKGPAKGVTELYCQNNGLTMLDVMQCEILGTLHCHLNLLTRLDLPSNVSLLSVSDNNLTTLDVSNLSGLGKLSCYNNQLTQLDVSSNIGLTTLHCGNNPLDMLDVRPGNAFLRLLNCVATPLDKINLANSLTMLNGFPRGELIISEFVEGVQEICTAKNWDVTVYT